MALYKVEVTCANHRQTYMETTYIVLEASSDADAVLLALQMAHTTFPIDGMPINALLLSFPLLS